MHMFISGFRQIKLESEVVYLRINQLELVLPSFMKVSDHFILDNAFSLKRPLTSHPPY